MKKNCLYIRSKCWRITCADIWRTKHYDSLYELCDFPNTFNWKKIAQLLRIGLDRLGTHCLESFFENVINRNVINHCKNFDSYDNLLSNAAHSIISSNFLYDVRMISWNKKSLNDGSSLFYLSLEEHRVHISTFFIQLSLQEYCIIM